MKIVLVFLFAVFIMACAARKSAYMDDNTFKLTESSSDSTYGYTEANPVKVGGIKMQSGPSNETRFLNALAGPHGEQISYYRSGSCCSFKTPNAVFGRVGLLDLYKIVRAGSPDTLSLYLNMYDKGDLKIPVGLSAKKDQ